MWGYPFPPLPAHLGKPVHPIRPKTLDYCLASWFEMESSTETVCWRLFFISLPFFFPLLGPFDQRQPTQRRPSYRSPPSTNSTFCTVLELLSAQPVYRICVDGMPWRPPRLASKAVHRNILITLRFHACKKPSKHSLETSISYTLDRHC